MNLILKVHGSDSMFGRTHRQKSMKRMSRSRNSNWMAGLKKLIVDDCSPNTKLDRREQLDEMFPKYKELDRREQVNRDGIHRVNERCSDNKSELIKLWNEKDKEKEAHDQKFTSVRRIIREMQDELDKKAYKAKSTPDKKPGA